jgi:predicted Zn-ribbon and HTH transcriptional regulator
MTVSCPDCGSRYLRASRCRSVRERMRTLLGISPLRCADCGTRFVARTWDLSVITHSRCPKCLRMDLNVWTDQQYWPGPLTKLKIKLGAHPWRCEYCRYNFASFRPRLERFSFNRWREKAQAREEPHPGPPDSEKGAQ